MKYIAYGSNLNLRQMARRCPTAKVVGIGWVLDYQLTFRGVATIVPKEGARTPVGIWEIDKAAEEALDRYEGFPRLYRKEMVKVEWNGDTVECMVYLMNGCAPSLPCMMYYQTIQDGYRDVGLDESYLIGALEDTEDRIKKKVG